MIELLEEYLAGTLLVLEASVLKKKDGRMLNRFLTAELISVGHCFMVLVIFLESDGCGYELS